MEFKKSVKSGQKNGNYTRMLGEFYIRIAPRMPENERTKQIQLKYDTKFHPNRTWNAIADAYSLKGDTLKANEYYDKGIEKNKDDWYSYNRKGILYQNQRDFKEAMVPDCAYSERLFQND
jgi:tetratricopeptide (TPR) repeat protein